MLWHAKYPFTVRLEDYARKEDYHGPVEELLESDEALELAEKRLDQALTQEKNRSNESIGRTAWEEVLSFHAALATAAKSGSLRLLRRLSKFEAERARMLLDGETAEGLITLAKRLGLRASYSQESPLTINWLYSGRRGVLPRMLHYSMPVSDYLQVASRLEDPYWRLVNSLLLGGRVYMDAPTFKELLAARVMLHVEDLAEDYAELELPRLSELGRRMASRLEWGVLGEFDPDRIPGCIGEILERARVHASITPEEFYTIATFLANTNAPREYVEETLYSIGFRPRSVATILAEAILDVGRKYKPYTCKVLLEKNLCRECRGRGPLAIYWSAIRRGRGR